VVKWGVLAAQQAFDECGRVLIRGVVVPNALGREMGQCIHYPFRRSLSEVVETRSGVLRWWRRVPSSTFVVGPSKALIRDGLETPT